MEMPDAREYVVVPREPTEAMVEAGLTALFWEAEFHPAADDAAVMARAFRAMVEAARELGLVRTMDENGAPMAEPKPEPKPDIEATIDELMACTHRLCGCEPGCCKIRVVGGPRHAAAANPNPQPRVLR